MSTKVEDVVAYLVRKYPEAKFLLDSMNYAARDARDEAKRCNYDSMALHLVLFGASRQQAIISAGMDREDIHKLIDIGAELRREIKDLLKTYCGCK